MPDASNPTATPPKKSERKRGAPKEPWAHYDLDDKELKAIAKVLGPEETAELRKLNVTQLKNYLAYNSGLLLKNKYDMNNHPAVVQAKEDLREAKESFLEDKRVLEAKRKMAVKIVSERLEK